MLPTNRSPSVSPPAPGLTAFRPPSILRPSDSAGQQCSSSSEGGDSAAATTEAAAPPLSLLLVCGWATGVLLSGLSPTAQLEALLPKVREALGLTTHPGLASCPLQLSRHGHYRRLDRTRTLQELGLRDGEEVAVDVMGLPPSWNQHRHGVKVAHILEPPIRDDLTPSRVLASLLVRQDVTGTGQPSYRGQAGGGWRGAVGGREGVMDGGGVVLCSGAADAAPG